MSKKKQSFEKEFKEDVIKYVLSHPDEPKIAIAKKFGIADSTIHAWLKKYKADGNEVIARGSGNYASDEAKENARLKKQLKDTQDALDVLKKAIGILGK
jgi:transposase